MAIPTETISNHPGTNVDTIGLQALAQQENANYRLTLYKLIQKENMYFLAGSEQRWRDALRETGVTLDVTNYGNNFRSIPFQAAAHVLNEYNKSGKISDFIDLVHDSITQQLSTTPPTSVKNYYDRALAYKTRGVVNFDLPHTYDDLVEAAGEARLHTSAAILGKLFEHFGLYPQGPALEGGKVMKEAEIALYASHLLREKTKYFPTLVSIVRTNNTINQIDKYLNTTSNQTSNPYELRRSSKELTLAA